MRLTPHGPRNIKAKINRSVRSINEMSDVHIFQFHSGSAVGDAVTGAMFYIKDILEYYSLPSKIYVEHRDRRLANSISLIGQLRPQPEDLLIIHHSMGHELLPFIENLDCRKILVYHNITPPSFFDEDSPFRKYALIGLDQLSPLRQITECAIADSEFNARELTQRGYPNVSVIPLLRDFFALRNKPHDPTPYYYDEPRYQILFVGRICANKGQIHLVKFMERYRDAFDYPLYLTLIGHSNHAERYSENLLKAIADAGLEDRVTLAGHVSDEALLGHYRAADAYVSYSQHEGFGVPLIEAMSLDLPVIAYDSSAISGTLGGAGIRLSTTETPELAEQLSRLFYDKAWRHETLKRQRERLIAFDPDLLSKQFIDFVQPYLPPGCTPQQRIASPSAQITAARRYVVEGPCETSYSLAIVNRNLALALNDRSQTAATLAPAEGMPGYQLKEEGIREHPEIKPLLSGGPVDRQSTYVAIRNMYPMRAAGMTGDYRLVHLYWEESEIPWRLTRMLNRYVDGLVAPTEFVRRVYRNSGIRKPIAVSKCGVDQIAQNSLTVKSRKEGLPFKFVHVSSGLARKGIEELLYAYAIAFRLQDNVELIIKTHNNPTNVVRGLYNKIFAYKNDAPVVYLLFEDFTDEQMSVFLEQADAMVLPTRGEGFNMPAAEAMVLGIPVITTAYSGQIDFCKHDNCYLLDYEFESTGSHLGSTHAMWVRPNIEQLARTFRDLYSQRESAEMSTKVLRAQEAIADMTWSAAAANIDAFVDDLEQTRPEIKKLKLAWVSTWNTRCGIALYSHSIIKNMPPGWFDITIFANQIHDTEPDGPNVVRCWSDRGESLDRLIERIIKNGDQAVVFQYNFGFYTLENLTKAIEYLDNHGISTYVVFHKTKEASINGFVEDIGNYSKGFSLATRLIVHSVEDVNRLKSYGLVDNVVKMPLGAYRPKDIEKDLARQILGLKSSTFIIATYGFLLPHKGLQELILAFSLVTRKYPDALLLLTTALYPADVSSSESIRCQDLIKALDLSDRVILITDFLPSEESMLFLQAADIIAFAYQKTGESASAAVRFGLSALRPVLTTPLSIFEDVANMSARTNGMRPDEIADGLIHLYETTDEQRRLTTAQRLWLDDNEFQLVSERLANMVIGLHEDRHNVSVCQEISGKIAQKLNLPVADHKKVDVQGHAAWIDSIKDEAFVRMTWQRFLDRDIDGDELSTTLRRLRDGSTSREALYDEVKTSHEAQSRRASTVEIMESGSTTPGTSEMIPFADLDSGDDESFITNIYQRLLGREPDPIGLESRLASLADGTANRVGTVEAIVASEEFIRNNIPILIHYDNLIEPDTEVTPSVEEQDRTLMVDPTPPAEATKSSANLSKKGNAATKKPDPPASEV